MAEKDIGCRTPTDNVTKLQRATPASILKQLRATAALMCFDHIFGLPTMPITEMQRKLYNMYHGNEELNIVSQVELMCGGKGAFSEMFNVIQTVVTNPEADVNTESSDTSQSRSLVLHPALCQYQSHIQYTSGTHFTAAMLKCSTKKVTEDKCSGRFLLDLCKQTVANIKKASIVADEWLINNEQPSGTNWDDLYAHLIENHDKINPKEKVFTGFGNFICHTKYNDRRENLLNILSKNDNDAVVDTDKSRLCARKNMKSNRDNMRALQCGDSNIFKSRGYTIDSRIQMVEIAQFNDAQKMESINHTLQHLTNRNKLLLEERLQQINLAKIICPEYDANNEVWMKVNELSKDIDNLKKEIATEELKRSNETAIYSGRIMADKFLASVTANDNKLEHNLKESPRKRSVPETIDVRNVVDIDGESCLSKRVASINDLQSDITEQRDGSSVTSVSKN